MNKMDKAQKVCELYLEGKTKEEIAEVIGCKPSSINHYLNIGGIYIRKNVETAIPMIIKMRKQDKTLKEISESTGFSAKVISKELNKRGMGYKKYDLDFGDPKIDTSNLIYSDRKPRIHRFECDGKKYVDITELCGI